MVCIYNGILLNHKRELNNTICSNIDWPRDYHSKWSCQSQKDKYHISLVGSKKMIQVNLFTKQKHTHGHKKQAYGYRRGKGEGNKLGVCDNEIQNTI